MQKDKRKSELIALFDGCEATQTKLVDRLVDEVVFLEQRMNELKKLPFIEVHPRNPMKQRSTIAARQYKDTLASYSNSIRILMNILNKADEEAQNELLKKLEEFSL